MLDEASHERETPVPSYEPDAGKPGLTIFSPWPTSFAVCDYTDPEYPAGVADMAGYWAEENHFWGCCSIW